MLAVRGPRGLEESRPVEPPSVKDDGGPGVCGWRTPPELYGGSVGDRGKSSERRVRYEGGIVDTMVVNESASEGV